MVTGINFKKRVPVNMNGNYILEIALSPADVVFLCWFAFRERALSALLRIFGEHEAFEKKVEDETTKARENRLNRRL